MYEKINDFSKESQWWRHDDSWECNLENELFSTKLMFKQLFVLCNLDKDYGPLRQQGYFMFKRSIMTSSVVLITKLFRTHKNEHETSLDFITFALISPLFSSSPLIHYNLPLKFSSKIINLISRQTWDDSWLLMKVLRSIRRELDMK